MHWRRESATAHGHRLSWRRAGDGPAVLYLHDAGADTLGSPALDDLAVDHDVVALDLPGYGESDPPARLHTPGAVADLLCGVLDVLGWDRATVVGTSLGGWFSLELALAHPRRVAALLVSSAAGLQAPQSYLFELYRLHRADRPVKVQVEEGVLRPLPPHERDLAALHPAVVHAVSAPYAAKTAATAAATWHPHRPSPRMLARLPAIACPAAVVWGGRDPLVPVTHAYELARAIPGAVLEVVPGAGHLVACEHPRVFAAAIRRVSPVDPPR